MGQKELSRIYCIYLTCLLDKSTITISSMKPARVRSRKI